MDGRQPGHAAADRIYRFYMVAAALNMGGLGLASLGLTNEVLFQADPIRFSRFGVVMVLIWGLTYLAAAKPAATTPALSLVFAVEKLAYVVSWVLWISSPEADLSRLLEQDLLAGLFYSTYGAIDLTCLVGFLWAARAAHELRLSGSS